MAGLTDYTARAALAHVTGKAAIFALPTVYLALFTAVGSDAGTGFTEISGNGYARVAAGAASWNAASGSAPSTISNSAALAFPVPTGTWASAAAPAIAWGLYDAPTGGNLLAWDYLGSFSWMPATASQAAPAVLTAPAHGFANSDTFVVDNEYGGTLPGFSQSNFAGLLAVANATADTFTVTNGGTAVNTSSKGSVMLRKVLPQPVPVNAQVSFAPGALSLVMA